MRLYSGGFVVVSQGSAPGAAGLHLVELPLLRPEEQVFEAMMDGWRNQQLARNLALSTIEKRTVRLRAFFAHAGTYPWEWLPQHADEWFGDLRSVRSCAHSTMRSYQDALRSFCAYVSDPVYDWPSECEQRFGTHPVQIVHEWNTAVHGPEPAAGHLPVPVRPARRGGAIPLVPAARGAVPGGDDEAGLVAALPGPAG